MNYLTFLYKYQVFRVLEAKIRAMEIIQYDMGRSVSKTALYLGAGLGGEEWISETTLRFLVWDSSSELVEFGTRLLYRI